MKLTTYTDYGLRVLIHVALRGSRRTTIAEIAEAFGVSQNHLMKVVQALAHHGWLQTTRGKHGGLALAASAHAIIVGDVVRAMEGDGQLVDCGDGPCRIARACRLRGIFAEAQHALYAVLDRYTLADIVADEPALSALLFRERAPAARPGAAS